MTRWLCIVMMLSAAGCDSELQPKERYSDYCFTLMADGPLGETSVRDAWYDALADCAHSLEMGEQIRVVHAPGSPRNRVEVTPRPRPAVASCVAGKLDALPRTPSDIPAILSLGPCEEKDPFAGR